MKITKVEIIPVSSPMVKPMVMPNTYITEIHSIVVKIHTDIGLVGIADSGDTSSWYRGELQDTMIGMIRNVIAPKILIGEDPRNIEKIVGRMDLLVRDNNQAKATIDFALHDLKGKILGVPVYQMLGGRTVEAQKQGWVVSAGPAEKQAAEAVEAIANGYGLIKLKVGVTSIDEDVRAVAAVREAIGEYFPLTMDANGFWNYDRALLTLRRLDKYNLECIEQPLPWWDIEGMARLRQQVSTPIFADESAQELSHLRDLLERRACDGLFLKLQKAGGILKAQRWLTMARLANMRVMSGCMIGSSLEASPSVHLSVSNDWFSQFMHENLGPVTIFGQWSTTGGKFEEIAQQTLRYENGMTYPNEGPGFGIDLNEEFLARNLTKDREAVVIVA